MVSTPSVRTRRDSDGFWSTQTRRKTLRAGKFSLPSGCGFAPRACQYSLNVSSEIRGGRGLPKKAQKTYEQIAHAAGCALSYRGSKTFQTLIFKIKASAVQASGYSLDPKAPF